MLRRLLFTVLAIVLIGFIVTQIIYRQSKDLGDRVVSITVRPGDAFSTVAHSLDSANVIGSKKILKVAARLKGIDKKLIAGRYDFTGVNTYASVIEKLSEGDVATMTITIPEGLTIWRIASHLQRVLEVDSAEVMRVSKDSSFLATLGLPYLEGYLFPETYTFRWGVSVEDILSRFVQMFHEQTDSLWHHTPPNNLSRAEVMVLASIVEAEAQLGDERKTIASVYHNRLKKRMRLDADPTVIYGLGGLDRPLLRKDLEKVTPYNTYKKYGLPPTPINSPGLAAIQAVLMPDSTDFLYFVADGTGGHQFTKSNAEHNRARARISKALKGS